MERIKYAERVKKLEKTNQRQKPRLITLIEEKSKFKREILGFLRRINQPNNKSSILIEK